MPLRLIGQIQPAGQFCAKSVSMRMLFVPLLMLSSISGCGQSTLIQASGWPVMPVEDTLLGYFESQVNPAFLGVSAQRRIAVSSEKPFMLPGGIAAGGIQGQMGSWGAGLHGHFEQLGAWRLWRMEGLLGKQLNPRLALGATLFMQQQRAVHLDPVSTYGMRIGVRYQANTMWNWAAVASQRWTIGVKQTDFSRTEWLLVCQARMNSWLAFEAQLMDRGFHSMQSAAWIQFYPTSRLLFSSGMEWPARAFSMLAQIRQRYGVFTIRLRHQSWIGTTPGTRFEIHPPVNRQ